MYTYLVMNKSIIHLSLSLSLSLSIARTTWDEWQNISYKKVTQRRRVNTLERPMGAIFIRTLELKVVEQTFLTLPYHRGW